MGKGIRFKIAESASVRCLLEQHLAALFLSDGVNKYMANDDVLQTMLSDPDKGVAFTQIKLAYTVWLGMLTADRHAVLAKFYTLYANICHTGAGNGKTLTFCALFINEFAGILAEAMERPD